MVTKKKIDKEVVVAKPTPTKKQSIKQTDKKPPEPIKSKSKVRTVTKDAPLGRNQLPNIITMMQHAIGNQ
jgi:hypothetical protein